MYFAKNFLRKYQMCHKSRQNFSCLYSTPVGEGACSFTSIIILRNFSLSKTDFSKCHFWRFLVMYGYIYEIPFFLTKNATFWGFPLNKARFSSVHDEILSENRFFKRGAFWPFHVWFHFSYREDRAKKNFSSPSKS